MKGLMASVSPTLTAWIQSGASCPVAGVRPRCSAQRLPKPGLPFFGL